jgi:hypothetical protein
MTIGSAFLLVVGAAAGVQFSGAAEAANRSEYDVGSRPVYGPPAPEQGNGRPKVRMQDCRSEDAGEVVVCAQQRPAFRLDPDISRASRQAQDNGRSATSAVPAAQASCAASPTGCGTGLESLDLVNVALVVATAAVRAAKGDDWKKAFKTGGPDEYQLYLQAKRLREAHEADRARLAAAARRH